MALHDFFLKKIMSKDNQHSRHLFRLNHKEVEHSAQVIEKL